MEERWEVERGMRDGGVEGGRERSDRVEGGMEGWREGGGKGGDGK